MKNRQPKSNNADSTETLDSTFIPRAAIDSHSHAQILSCSR